MWFFNWYKGSLLRSTNPFFVSENVDWLNSFLGDPRLFKLRYRENLPTCKRLIGCLVWCWLIILRLLLYIILYKKLIILALQTHRWSIRPIEEANSLFGTISTRGYVCWWTWRIWFFEVILLELKLCWQITEKLFKIWLQSTKLVNLPITWIGYFWKAYSSLRVSRKMPCPCRLISLPTLSDLFLKYTSPLRIKLTFYHARHRDFIKMHSTSFSISNSMISIKDTIFHHWHALIQRLVHPWTPSSSETPIVIVHQMDSFVDLPPPQSPCLRRPASSCSTRSKRDLQVNFKPDSDIYNTWSKGTRSWSRLNLRWL